MKEINISSSEQINGIDQKLHFREVIASRLWMFFLLVISFKVRTKAICMCTLSQVQIGQGRRNNAKWGMKNTSRAVGREKGRL